MRQKTDDANFELSSKIFMLQEIPFLKFIISNLKSFFVSELVSHLLILLSLPKLSFDLQKAAHFFVCRYWAY